MAESFFERPILNSPYEIPRLHHALDEDGQPLDQPPVEGRRRSELITPVPPPRKRKNKDKGKQDRLAFGDKEGLSSSDQEYNPTPIINEIRSHVATWREVPNPNDWGVTPATARLLTYWRHHNFEGLRPFFRQIEAVETIICSSPRLQRPAFGRKQADKARRPPDGRRPSNDADAAPNEQKVRQARGCESMLRTFRKNQSFEW
jgi:hypothetical protein